MYLLYETIRSLLRFHNKSSMILTALFRMTSASGYEKICLKYQGKQNTSSFVVAKVRFQYRILSLDTRFEKLL